MFAIKTLKFLSIDNAGELYAAFFATKEKRNSTVEKKNFAQYLPHFFYARNSVITKVSFFYPTTDESFLIYCVFFKFRFRLDLGIV